MVDKDDKNNAGYEKRDINIFMVIGLSVLSVVLLIVILVFLIDYFVESKEQMIYEAQLQPESADLNSLLVAEEEELTSYKILDIDRGIYRIPVDRAMELLVKEASNTN
ncbi:MAG: hypothetical protein V3U02_02545 [Calditrichia bacterium]